MGGEQDFYNVYEAARVLEISPARVRQMLPAGELQDKRGERLVEGTPEPWRLPAGAGHAARSVRGAGQDRRATRAGEAGLEEVVGRRLVSSWSATVAGPRSKETPRGPVRPSPAAVDPEHPRNQISIRLCSKVNATETYERLDGRKIRGPDGPVCGIPQATFGKTPSTRLGG